MGGFLAGSLALIALEVFTSRGATAGFQAGSNQLVKLLRRFMSPDVPLIPDVRK